MGRCQDGLLRTKVLGAQAYQLQVTGWVEVIKGFPGALPLGRLSLTGLCWDVKK